MACAPVSSPKLSGMQGPGSVTVLDGSGREHPAGEMVFPKLRVVRAWVLCARLSHCEVCSSRASVLRGVLRWVATQHADAPESHVSFLLEAVGPDGDTWWVRTELLHRRHLEAWEGNCAGVLDVFKADEVCAGGTAVVHAAPCEPEVTMEQVRDAGEGMVWAAGCNSWTYAERLWPVLFGRPLPEDVRASAGALLASATVTSVQPVEGRAWEFTGQLFRPVAEASAAP